MQLASGDPINAFIFGDKFLDKKGFSLFSKIFGTKFPFLCDVKVFGGWWWWKVIMVSALSQRYRERELDNMPSPDWIYEHLSKL